ncbi:MAG: 30S ribosomal protein S13 [Nitrospiraceae bacterium]|nr:30S ribosomal protein S13 [Nitrospiraceae bacterium]
MARIAGVDLPKNERIEIGLTRIFGIGRSLSKQILKDTGVNPDIRVKDLKDEDIVKIRASIEKECKVEGDLRRENSMNIKRLTDIGCYRGVRHKQGLPVRGQRTKTNARTRRGPRKTIMGKKKEV